MQKGLLHTLQGIRSYLHTLYLEDARPWLVGFSGGKDSTMLASLIFDTVLSVPPDQRKKDITLICTDTRVEIPTIVEIPAIVEMVEGTLARMKKRLGKTRSYIVHLGLSSTVFADT